MVFCSSGWSPSQRGGLWPAAPGFHAGADWVWGMRAIARMKESWALVWGVLVVQDVENQHDKVDRGGSGCLIAGEFYQGSDVGN